MDGGFKLEITGNILEPKDLQFMLTIGQAIRTHQKAEARRAHGAKVLEEHQKKHEQAAAAPAEEPAAEGAAV